MESGCHARESGRARRASVIAAPSQAADQEADPERDGCRRVRVLLDCIAQEIIGLVDALIDRLRGAGGGVFGLPVEVLERAFGLLRLALQLRPHVSGRASETFLYLAAELLGAAGQPIFVHGCFSSVAVFLRRGVEGQRSGTESVPVGACALCRAAELLFLRLAVVGLRPV